MKYLAFILLTISIISCKSNHNAGCDAYGQKTIAVPYVDTVVMDPLHYHFENEYVCFWVMGDTIIYNDTLYIEYITEDQIN